MHDWGMGWHMGWMWIGWAIGFALAVGVLWQLVRRSRGTTTDAGSSRRIEDNPYANPQLDREEIERERAKLREEMTAPGEASDPE